MNPIHISVGIILIVVILGGLWGLTRTIKECETDGNCIPTDPLVGVIYYCENGVCKTKPFGNPASEYCAQHDGTIETRTDPDGGQYGVCIFSDGSECGQWDFYNGECQPGLITTTITTTTPQEHHGSSTHGKCSIDDDCITGGCNGEICQSKSEEPLMSICVYDPPYPKDFGYECKCIDQECMWFK